MKLSEKIQEALRQQQEINLSDPAVQKRLAAQWGYVPADAQPAPSFADAYMLALSQGEAVIRGEKAYEPTDHLPPRHASHDAERIAKADAKRARKAAKRAKLPEAKP